MIPSRLKWIASHYIAIVHTSMACKENRLYLPWLYSPKELSLFVRYTVLALYNGKIQITVVSKHR